MSPSVWTRAQSHATLARASLLVALGLAGCIGPGLQAPVTTPSVAAPPATSAASSTAPDATPSGYNPTRITPDEVRARQTAGTDLLVVDVRPVEAYNDEHVTGAINAPWKDLPHGFAQLPKDRLLVLYCT